MSVFEVFLRRASGFSVLIAPVAKVTLCQNGYEQVTKWFGICYKSVTIGLVTGLLLLWVQYVAVTKQ